MITGCLCEQIGIGHTGKGEIIHTDEPTIERAVDPEPCAEVLVVPWKQWIENEGDQALQLLSSDFRS